MAVCIIEILNSDNSLIVKHGKPPHFIAIPLRSLLSIPLDETEVIRVDSNCDIDEFIIALFHRSEEHTSELQSLMRISYAVFCLQTKTHTLLNNTKPKTSKQQLKYKNQS